MSFIDFEVHGLKADGITFCGLDPNGKFWPATDKYVDWRHEEHIRCQRCLDALDRLAVEEDRKRGLARAFEPQATT